MPIKIKPGASIENCGPEILRAAIAIDPIFSAQGADLVITSGSENYKHSAERSKHYSGDAIDVRSKNIPESERKSVAAKIKSVSRGTIIFYKPVPNGCDSARRVCQRSHR